MRVPQSLRIEVTMKCSVEDTASEQLSKGERIQQRSFSRSPSAGQAQEVTAMWTGQGEGRERGFKLKLHAK